MTRRGRSIDEGVPLFQGAFRAKLFFGIDARILVVFGVLFLLGFFSFFLGIRLFGLAMLTFSGIVFALGKYLGATSPYCVDELLTYFSWRSHFPHAHAPDDCYPNSCHWVTEHRSSDG